jgi:diaminopimelate decarboxylase
LNAGPLNTDLPWWLGDALAAGPRGLTLDGVPLADLARRHGTPLYVYSAATVRRRLAELRGALRSTGAPFRIHYAMKANRFGPFLATIRAEGDVGIDACSPREVERALAAGFAPDEISVTSSMVSNRDLETLAGYGVHLNLDTRSALRRQAALGRGVRRVGLRIDPAVRVGWGDSPKLAYGQSKFGFEPDAVLDAAAEAASLGLEVDELHVHSGWGLQADAAPLLSGVFARLAELARALPTVRTLNVGGGLCWRQRAEDEPLAPATWAALLRQHLAPTGCTIACEPGTFVAASCGVLLAEVNTVETRRSGTWIGLDAGHNVNGYAAHYHIPHAILSVERPLDPPVDPVHVAGNINEAVDVFARSVRLPRLAEGDLVAFFPAGGYGASMASDHCMRGLPNEVMV